MNSPLLKTERNSLTALYVKDEFVRYAFSLFQVYPIAAQLIPIQIKKYTPNRKIAFWGYHVRVEIYFHFVQPRQVRDENIYNFMEILLR